MLTTTDQNIHIVTDDTYLYNTPDPDVCARLLYDGLVVFDHHDMQLKTYFQGAWKSIQTPRQDISFPLDTQFAIDWVKTQMADTTLSELANKHPQVKDAITQLATVIKLCEGT